MDLAQFRKALDEVVGEITEREWKDLDLRSGVHLDDQDVLFYAERVRRSRTEAEAEVSVGLENPAKLAKRASKYSEAVSALAASDASRMDLVRSVRESVLGGELLKPGEVQAWLENESERGESVERIVLGEAWEVDRQAEGREWIGGRPVIRRERPEVQFAIPGSKQVQRVSSSSTLEPVRKLSESLAAIYGWQPATATVFILTGFVPMLAQISSRLTMKAPILAASRITMSIDPTVTPQEVADQYAALRRRMTGGRRFRRLAPKSLKLAIFADSHPEGTWQERMKEWNRAHPKERYSEWRNFQRDAASATRRLLKPKFEV